MDVQINEPWKQILAILTSRTKGVRFMMHCSLALASLPLRTMMLAEAGLPCSKFSDSGTAERSQATQLFLGLHLEPHNIVALYAISLADVCFLLAWSKLYNLSAFSSSRRC